LNDNENQNRRLTVSELRFIFGPILGLMSGMAAFQAIATWNPMLSLASGCFAACAIVLMTE
jgi:hypothetical protein